MLYTGLYIIPHSYLIIMMSLKLINKISHIVRKNMLLDIYLWLGRNSSLEEPAPLSIYVHEYIP